MLDLAATRNVIEKSGSWFNYKGQRLGQGRDGARQFLKENPELFAKINTELRSVLGLAAIAEYSSVKAAVASGENGTSKATSDFLPLK